MKKRKVGVGYRQWLFDDELLLKRQLTLRDYQSCVSDRYIDIIGLFCLLDYALKYDKPYEEIKKNLCNKISVVRNLKIRKSERRKAICKGRAIRIEICEFCEWNTLDVISDFASLEFEYPAYLKDRKPVYYFKDTTPVLEMEFCEKFLNSLDCLIDCLAEKITIDEFFRICFNK